MPAPKRVLMKDVAAKAGVHQTTVSLALRGHPGLPEKTRKHICEVADEMGYRPDPSLRALNSYRRRSKDEPVKQAIAYIVNIEDKNDIQGNHVYKTYLESARQRAEELGFNLELFQYGGEHMNSKSLDRILKARGIKGIILGAFTRLYTDIELDWSQYAVVKIEMLPIDLEIDSVLSNQMFAVRLAMRELRKIGVTRVGLAVAEHDEIHNRNLFTGGYAVAQRHLSVEDRIDPLIFKIKPQELLHAEVKEWALNNQLDAIVSNWNSLAKVAWTVGKETNRACRFVSLDSNEYTRQYGGVDQNHAEAARWAVDLLEGKLTTFKYGLNRYHGMTLVDPIWIPFTPWNLETAYPESVKEFMPGISESIFC